MSAFKIPPGNLIALDLETTGLSARRGDQFYCASFCNMEGESAVLSFPVDPFTRQVRYTVELNKIQKFLADPTIDKVGHNVAFDMSFFREMKFKVRGKVLDTMVLIRLVRSDAPIGLKKFCKEYLGIQDDDEKTLKEKTRQERRKGKTLGYKIFNSKNEDSEGSLPPDYWLAGPKFYEPYALRDAERCMAVYTALEPEIQKQNLTRQWEVEKKTWKILRKIENKGIRVFREQVIENKNNVKKKLLEFKILADRLVPLKTNLNSSLQLRKIFYENLKISSPFLTANGNPSVDSDALKFINHPLAHHILNLRACKKTVEFMDQYLYHMVKNGDGGWYIHPTFHQAVAVTGRESCANPNLQQVASGESDKGADVRVEARSVFGPRKGFQLRSYDWKNIEVYIPAFASQDPVLTSILKEGGDVHQHTADSLTKRLGRSVTRFQGKRTFFGLQYGIGSEKLAKTLGSTVEMALRIREAFEEEYAGLNLWMKTISQQAQQKGFIKTAYGYKRFLKPFEAYKAVNYYVQGTASSILKESKIKIFEKFREQKKDIYMVLSVHDEILMEIRDGINMSEVDGQVVRCMQDNPELKMPIKIPVSISQIGINWADKKTVKVL